MPHSPPLPEHCLHSAKSVSDPGTSSRDVNHQSTSRVAVIRGVKEAGNDLWDAKYLKRSIYVGYRPTKDNSSDVFTSPQLATDPLAVDCDQRQQSVRHPQTSGLRYCASPIQRVTPTTEQTRPKWPSRFLKTPALGYRSTSEKLAIPFQSALPEASALHLSDEMSTNRESDLPEGKPDKSRGKQQIEAHLSNEEPLANARSRKASHYLGLFKENVTVRDHDSAQVARSEWEQGSSISQEGADEDRERRIDQDSRFFATETASSVTAAKYNANILSPSKGNPHAESSTDVQNKNDHTRQATGSEPAVARRSKLRKVETAGDVVQDQQSIEWRSSTPTGGSLPIRLLEEIRKWRRSDRAGSERSRRQSLGSSRVKSDGRLESVAPRESAPHSLRGNLKPQRAIEEEPDFDSDKEHISSATYFPHRGPSPDDSVENLRLDGVLAASANDNLRGLQRGHLEADRLPDETSPLPTGKHVNSARAIHQDSSKERQHVHRHIDPNTISAAPHAFTSHWENEPATRATFPNKHTDWQNYQATETAKSTTTTKLLKEKSYSADYPPLGAVALKPYKHQVGGHTKVFSFSRQAICKQLNNRENVFYEVIERSHPELLRFLPRYLGVLNVTYQKVLKHRVSMVEPSSANDSARTGGHTPDERGRGSDPLVQLPLRDESSLPSRSAITSTRTISHSHQFESADDSVPQVIYANNMHMIPVNLFPLSAGGVHPNGSPTSLQDGSGGAKHPRNNIPFEDREFQRPPLPQSPSWGATTVNTRFKDKVLREVFSPPVVHHRKKHGRYGKGVSLEAPSAAESSNASQPKSTHHRAITMTNSLQPPSPSQEQNGLARSAGTSQDHTERQPEQRIIARRRSGSGLRRGQIDIDDPSRSSFKYFDDNKAIQEESEDPVFAIDLPEAQHASHLSAQPGLDATNGIDDLQRQFAYNESVVDIPESAMLNTMNHYMGDSSGLGPLNPVQAQQHRDEHVKHFLLLEDLTANMSKPCVLDLKMGTRQYGVDATKKKQVSQRQKCRTTTSQQLGVRVCGMQVWNSSRKEYVFEDKYVGRDFKAGRDFQSALARFLYDGVSQASVARHIPLLLEKLLRLEKIIISLPGYRFYASSLLMLYDGASPQADAETSQQITDVMSQQDMDSRHGKALFTKTSSDIEVKLVDFANCITSEDDLAEETQCPPRDRHGVDRGYLRGLRSLRTYLQRIWREIEEGEWVERGEGEGMGLRMKGAGGIMDQPDGWQEGWEESGNVSL